MPYNSSQSNRYLIWGALLSAFAISDTIAKSKESAPPCPSGYSTIPCPSQEQLLQYLQKGLKLIDKEWKIIGNSLNLQSTNVEFFHKVKGKPLFGNVICLYGGGLQLEMKSLDFSPNGCYLQCGTDRHTPAPRTGASCEKVQAHLCCKEHK